MKSCIAFLTRGYENKEKYSMLIIRNKCIEKRLEDKSIHLLFFHEGNITEEHQEYIKSFTPSLQMIFINIQKDNLAWRKEKEEVHKEKSVNFNNNVNYKHMCSFWFIDFWNFVKEYDYLMRIDEDCFVEFSIDSAFTSMINRKSVIEYGMWIGDHYKFCKDMEVETKKSLGKHSPMFPSGPYTNIILFNLNSLLNNTLLHKYIKDIDNSNGIYIYRWGDLPLWGEVIKVIYQDKLCYLSREIKYYHDSHKMKVNM